MLPSSAGWARIIRVQRPATRHPPASSALGPWTCLPARLLSPLATVVLVLLTLLGALPVYRRLDRDARTPAPWWSGKVFVLILLGFAATDFMLTITLSAADAVAHLVENPYVPPSVEIRGS